MAPLLLFRKEIPGSITAPGVRRSNSGKRLSRWPKYVAWMIVVVSSVVSSFFVIMYSLDWGREKSEAWLKAFFLSFCLSSVVAETGQLLILALLAAWICNPTPSSKQRKYEIKTDKLHLHLLDRKASEKVHPPGVASVLRMKRKNNQRRRFFFVLQEYILLFLFVAVLFFISQQDKDPFAFHASRTLSTTLTEDFDSRNNWIDQYTKWLVLEMSFYYPSRKLFSSLRMVVQRNNVGHLSTSAVVGTHRVFQYENTSDYGVMIAHILFIFFFLATFIMEVVNIEGEGMRFFLSVWNLISFVSIVGSAVVICAFGIRYHFASEALKMIVEVTGELGIDHFVDFESTFWWDEAFKIVLAILVFVNTLKMLRVVRFNKTIAKFLALPGAMKNDLIGFSVTSAIVFMAFISSGMVVFGTHMKAFSNVLHTNYALFDMLLGRFVAEEILEANRYVGPVYFTLFMICIFIILVNFLVTIICDAIASDASIENDYDQELVDYIWKTFQQIFGIHSPPTQDVKAGEEILSDLDSNLRMIEESLDDTLDVACSICPDAEDTSDGTSFNRKDQRVALSLLSKKPSKDTYETANEAAPQASTSVMSLVYEEAQSVLRTHEDDAAKLNEVQNETRRRAQAIVQRKLAAKRRIKQARHGGERLASIAESAEVLLEQHADDEERLERQYQNNRRQFENKLQQKLTARRKQKDKEKK
ncbi:polycystin-2-like [Branchiostoma floridae]|uniref:Polycystin-2-like n=1 Tax=Branchiostoma floridae TaxID=7739 RepID=A0A9J7N4S1_BRAFL|nr:polycystin-2-like [Branchiostoma floridae]